MIRAGEGLMHLLETLSSTKLDSANNKSHRIQMHTCGITLWNLSVAMKTGRAMSDQLNAKGNIMFLVYLPNIYVL